MSDPNENGSSKQGLSRAHMVSIWAAIATALGSQGIPKIIDMLENKTSEAQVQAMIAQKTQEILRTVNQLVDAAKERGERVEKLQQAVAYMGGALAAMQTNGGHHVEVRPEAPPLSAVRVSKRAKKKRGGFLGALFDDDEDEPDGIVIEAPRKDSPQPEDKLRSIQDFGPQMQQRLQLQGPTP